MPWPSINTCVSSNGRYQCLLNHMEGTATHPSPIRENPIIYRPYILEGNEPSHRKEDDDED